jgi:hypothetical protein
MDDVYYYLILIGIIIVGVGLIYMQAELFGGFVVVVSSGLIVGKILGYNMLG